MVVGAEITLKCKRIFQVTTNHAAETLLVAVPFEDASDTYKSLNLHLSGPGKNTRCFNVFWTCDLEKMKKLGNKSIADMVCQTSPDRACML